VRIGLSRTAASTRGVQYNWPACRLVPHSNAYFTRILLEKSGQLYCCCISLQIAGRRHLQLLQQGREANATQTHQRGP
jgi:hypothetical protein